MGLYRRKNSDVWWMSFTYDGKQYQRSAGTNDRKEALRRLDSIKGKIAEKKWFPETLKDERQYFTFTELAERYVAFKSARLKSQKAVDNEGSIIRMFDAKIGDIRLDETTTQIMEQVQTDMIARGNKPATVNRKFDVLRNMFTKAGDWDMIGKDTLGRVKKVKPFKLENMRLRYLAKDECFVLINACIPHLKPIVVTALNTGMRLAEILNLEWDRHIDLKHGFILLDKTKNSNRREIPINDTLRRTLQGVTRRLDVPYVFFNRETGKPYKEIKHGFRSACRRAGIHDFHFHDLRHTFASHLIMAGVDITTVSRLLGHKSLTMTLRYAHLAPSHMVKAVSILDVVLTGKSINKEADYDIFITSAIDRPLTAKATH